MSYTLAFLLGGMVLAMIGVASNPSPYFGAIGLVAVAGMGCGVMSLHGGGFLSLVLFLIYLGGMLVVFAYTASLASEINPESWLSSGVAVGFSSYSVGVLLVMGSLCGGWYGMSYMSVDELGDLSMFRGDVEGVSAMYAGGGGLLVLGAWVLLVTLFVVLEVTRGLSRGALRAV